MNKISVIPVEYIARKIYMMREQKVMLDSDLAEMYGVDVKRLNEQVRRNVERFPEDFMFQLTNEEYENLRSQIVILNEENEEDTENLRSQNATSSQWGGRRYMPYAFTEQGVAMLSSVLRSERAVEVNIAIIRAFVKMRHMLATHQDIARKIEEHDHHIARLYDFIEQILYPAEGIKKKRIGYVPVE